MAYNYSILQPKKEIFRMICDKGICFVHFYYMYYIIKIELNLNEILGEGENVACNYVMLQYL